MQKQNEFRLPYSGIDLSADMDLLYGMNGEFSVLIRMVNPVLRYSGDASGYDGFHSLFLGILKMLGEGYVLQKQDVFFRAAYEHKQAGTEYLNEAYFAHFSGREYVGLETVLVLTRQVPRGRFYVHDPAMLRDFKLMVVKVMGILEQAGCLPILLREKEINRYIMRIISLNFSDGNVVLDNFKPGESEVGMGKRSFRSVSLIDIDQINLPASLATSGYLSESDALAGFPADFLPFLFKVPDFSVMVFNQVIEVPAQSSLLRGLELKQKRHSGIPDAANLICVEDISSLLNDVARDNRLLVHAHFNVLVCADNAKLSRACNFLESALFQIGIIPSANAYNQMELFRTVLPGNSVELKKYDWFMTTAEAALCLFFKESLQGDEDSSFLVRFTDRQGIPLAMDPMDLPMKTGRINNRNKFVLGPSGSGKSFFMNALIEQYLRYDMDVVIVDTGHSYSGLCAYFGGKYLTYSEHAPITMNPFSISKEEYNIEKKDFLVTLVCLIWKGTDGVATQVEKDVISAVINGYYLFVFEGLKVNEFKLGFDSFYEFALSRIPEIKQREKIIFDIDEFRYVLKKFYKGGEFAQILNEDADASLLTERMIVFEIDSIKNHKVLFPIVTLIIMDVFIQKMRFRNAFRKSLILEEAWKSLASPLMADYILFLFKTVRKFWGEVIVVTQELGDIIGNAIVKDSIISNSDTVCLLDQRKFRDNYADIAALLSISEVERKMIFSINQLDNQAGRGPFKEVYIRRGSVGEVYGVEVSLAQYLCFTTEKPEKMALELYQSRFGSYQEAIQGFIADFLSSGKDLGSFVTLVNSSAGFSV
ncbi:TraG family conjugative transposon ATPase [Agrobacterium tumefaciens]|nr:TraG family conjugative transposon ATPase [Agrobacterium tumefaciens]NTE22174.1 TraG family conjugative transposon ATPase [Agrobacterium tumefaciens]